MRMIIVTGMSGAGITTALKYLEDEGFFCIDNLPIPLMGRLADLASELRKAGRDKIALGLDARSGDYLEEMEASLDILKEAFPLEILFMDAQDSTLVRRYKETRRGHPMAPHARVEEGIALERQKMAYLRKKATYILDTSRLLTRELRQELGKILFAGKPFESMMVTVLSFGYKYGIPTDADLVFDVRFLPNPFYVEELRPLTGLDEAVYSYVMHNEEAATFAEKSADLLSYLLPLYSKEGKTSLVIGVGCTGGKHRSVSVARRLYDALLAVPGYGVRLEHRDILR